jgi:hypothetical protein
MRHGFEEHDREGTEQVVKTGIYLSHRLSRYVHLTIGSNFKRSLCIGTESMTFPLTLRPGETGYLANPNQDRYYFWKGDATSAHYYINKQGVSEAEGCTWSTPSDARGNWAPAIFGTSFDDRIMNTGFSSLKQNELNRGAQLDYSISFTGDGVACPCSYRKSTNQYCENNNCWSVKDEPNRGCTVSCSLIIILMPLILSAIGVYKARRHSHACPPR